MLMETVTLTSGWSNVRVIVPVGEGDLEEGRGTLDSKLEMLSFVRGRLAELALLLACSKLSSALRSKAVGFIPEERVNGHAVIVTFL